MRGALLVGIDDYAFGKLDGCVNDTKLLAPLLSEHENGDPNFEVRCLTSDTKTIKKTDLQSEIDRLFSREAEIALFYFSGHGTVTKSGGYIVTPDATKYGEGVSMNDILLYANQSKAAEKIIILDCCNSGRLGESYFADNASILSPGVTLLAASRSNEAAIQQGGISLFTSLLLSACKGGAADVLGKVTTAGVYSYIDSILGFFDQRPMYKTNVSKLVNIRNCQMLIERSVFKRLRTYFPYENYLYKLDPSYEKTSGVSDLKNVDIMSDFQKLRAGGLLEPIPPNPHLYYAAINSEFCRLTRLGQYYWHLAKESKI